MVRRVLCLRLPFFGVERLARERGDLRDRPFALHPASPQKTKGLPILEASARARAAGLRPGQTIGEARSACEGLIALPQDAALEAEALEQLALWGRRWSPRPATYGDRAIALELDRDSRIFGGEAALLGQATSAARALGYTASGAIAPSPAAAHAIASAWPDELVILRDVTDPRLEALPTLALGLPQSSASWLERLGLETIGALRELPRDELASRFPEVLARLDELFDPTRHDPRWRPARGRPRWRESWRFDDPPEDRRILEAAILRLLRRLSLRLEGARGPRAVRRLRLELGEASLTLTLRRPRARPEALLDHLREALDERGGIGPIPAIAVEAVDCEEPEARAGQLFEDAAEQAKAPVEALIERLVGRLGASCVGRLELRDDHRPERRAGALTLSGRVGGEGDGYRPLRLHPRPRPVTVDGEPASPRRILRRGRWLILERVIGPERIRAGFWEQLSDRDYFAACAGPGLWLWLYWDREAQAWFEHGLFD